MSELQDLVALIRANTPLLVIETPDEARVIELFRQTLMHAWRAMYRWSITEGGRRFEADAAAVRQIVRNLQGTRLTDARRIARHLIYRDGVLGADDLPELSRLKFAMRWRRPSSWRRVCCGSTRSKKGWPPAAARAMAACHDECWATS